VKERKIRDNNSFVRAASASVYKLVITYACDEYIALLYAGEITRGSVTKCYEQSIIV